MTRLDPLLRATEKIPKLGRLIAGYRKLKEANQICSHFSTYLGPVVATSPELKTEVYKIRHAVYCEELHFEEVRENGLETDEFDAYSQYCLIHHMNSGNYAGTVRIVTPENKEQLLPLEKYCLNSITHKQYNPLNFPRNEICEISRLAVPHAFRRRQMDNFDGAATGAINTQTFSEKELRCFPFIAVGLYLTAASLVIKQDINHVFVMMEPRLARSMRFLGIRFEQIGPVIDYHGKRAPYYITPNRLIESLSPGFKKMLSHIMKSVNNSTALMK